MKLKSNNKNTITLVVTKAELLALTDTLDSFSALSDSIEDDGSAKKDIKKLDKMLERNGWKREYT